MLFGMFETPQFLQLLNFYSDFSSLNNANSPAISIFLHSLCKHTFCEKLLSIFPVILARLNNLAVLYILAYINWLPNTKINGLGRKKEISPFSHSKCSFFPVVFPALLLPCEKNSGTSGYWFLPLFFGPGYSFHFYCFCVFWDQVFKTF